jgi:hypothetical protein
MAKEANPLIDRIPIPTKKCAFCGSGSDGVQVRNYLFERFELSVRVVSSLQHRSLHAAEELCCGVVVAVVALRGCLERIGYHLFLVDIELKAGVLGMVSRLV